MANYPAKQKEENTGKTVSRPASVNFQEIGSVQKSFIHLTHKITELLEKENASTLKLTCKKIVTDVHLPKYFCNKIQSCDNNTSDILSVLTLSPYWNWIDIRLMEAVAAISTEAINLIKEYKKYLYPQRLVDLLSLIPAVGEVDECDYKTMSVKIGTNIDVVTIKDFFYYRHILETKLLNLKEGSCILDHVEKESFEIGWLIPSEKGSFSYESAKRNSKKFHEISLLFVHIQSCVPIYQLQSPDNESNLKKLPSVSANIPPPLPPRISSAKNSPDNESIYVNLKKLPSVSGDVPPPPLPPRTRTAKNTDESPIKKVSNQLKGAKVSQPRKANSSDESKLGDCSGSKVKPPAQGRSVFPSKTASEIKTVQRYDLMVPSSTNGQHCTEGLSRSKSSSTLNDDSTDSLSSNQEFRSASPHLNINSTASLPSKFHVKKCVETDNSCFSSDLDTSTSLPIHTNAKQLQRRPSPKPRSFSCDDARHVPDAKVSNHSSCPPKLTAEDVKNIFDEYNPQLVQYLPMKDHHFIAKLTQQRLLSSGSHKENVMFSTKPTEAASYFLYHVVELALRVEDREPFDKLLLVMEKFGDVTLNKLARKINQKLGGMHHIDSPEESDQDQVFAPEESQPYITKLDIQQSESEPKEIEQLVKAESEPKGLAKAGSKPKKVPLLPALKSGKYSIKWRRCANLMCPMYAASIATDKKYVYVMGDCVQKQALNVVFAYKIATNSWIRLPPSDHCYGVLQMVGDKLTIFGGINDYTDKRTNRVSTFDKSTKSWRHFYPDMIDVRFRPGVATHLDHVIVAGGNKDPINIHNDIEVLNWHLCNQWVKSSICLPMPMWAFSPIISNNEFYIVGYTGGGRNRVHREAYKIPVISITSSLELKHLVTKEWINLPPSPYYYNTLVPNSSPPVFVGGDHEVQHGAQSSNVSMYDSSSNSWRYVDSLSSPKSNVAVATIDDYSIIVIGGRTKGHSITAAKLSSLPVVEIGQAELA